MKVCYYLPYYSGTCEARHARMHDVFHWLNRQASTQFEYDIYTIFTKNVESNRVRSIQAPLTNIQQFSDQNKLSLRVIKRIIQYRLFQEIKKNQYDVFHSTVLDPLALRTVKYLKSLKHETKTVVGPNIMKIHQHRMTDELHSLQTDTIDIVIAISNYHRDVLVENGVPPSKIKILPPSVDPRFFFLNSNKASNERFTILYAGALSKFKGIDTFMSALEMLKSWGIDFDATISGAGQYDLSQHHQVSGNVSAVGYTKRAEMHKLYHNSDIYVHPGTDEFGPTTILEALACGTPCVLSDLKSFWDYGSKDCHYFPVGDAGILAEKLLKVYRGWSAGNMMTAKQMNNHGSSIDYLAQLYKS